MCTNFLKERVWQVFKSMLSLLLGSTCCILFVCFLLLSVPIYGFRVVVIFMGKRFRPDLGDIVSAESVLFVHDFLSEHNPRSNNVMAMTFQGHLSLEEIRKRVLKNWISAVDASTGKLKFENFQCYPVKWFGFAFWKKTSSSFLLDRHVYRYSDKSEEVTDQQLTKLMEDLLNRKNSKYRSPWELILIENYVHSNPEMASTIEQGGYSVLVLKWHHCLMDGTGVVNALVQGLFEKDWAQVPEAELPQVTPWQKIFDTIAYPVQAFLELSKFYSHTFRSSPLKIPDCRKKWYQMYIKSGPISVQLIKNIKNAFGVTYTSVVLSAFSAGLYKTLKKRGQREKSMLCLSVIPAKGITKRKILANHMTGAPLDLPTCSFDNPAKRLWAVERQLQKAKMSVCPTVGQYCYTLIGAHFYFVSGYLIKNRMIPIGVSNFPGVRGDMEFYNGIKWIHTEDVAGGHIGDTGIVVRVSGHGRFCGVQISVERGLMTREDAKMLMQFIKEEIQNLGNLIPEKYTVEGKS